MEEVHTSEMQIVDIINAYQIFPVLGSIEYFEEEELLPELEQVTSKEVFLGCKDKHVTTI